MFSIKTSIYFNFSSGHARNFPIRRMKLKSYVAPTAFIGSELKMTRTHVNTGLREKKCMLYCTYKSCSSNFHVIRENTFISCSVI